MKLGIKEGIKFKSRGKQCTILQKRRVLTNGVEDTAWERGIKFKKRFERKTVTRENGNSILRSNGYVNLKDREEHIQKLQGRVSRRKSYIDYLQEKIIHMYSCELDKSLSHKVTRDTLLLGDGSWNKNVLSCGL